MIQGNEGKENVVEIRETNRTFFISKMPLCIKS
jgi:hypothetical protein